MTDFRINPDMGYKPYNQTGFVTPDIEHSEGMRPAGSFMPANYLPQVRFDIFFKTAIVVSAGKPVAFDSNGRLVPAGLALELALGAASTLVYTQADVDQGTLNAQGVLATVGEKVVTSMIAAGITVSNHVGIAPYNYFKAPGGDGENPVDYTFGGFNAQHKVAFLTDYVIRVPVATAAGYTTAVMPGITALIGNTGTVKPGQYITYDKDSNFVVADAAYGKGANPERVAGMVLQVETGNPALMNIIRSPTVGTDKFGDPLARLNGTATGGKEQAVYYANGYATATINLIER